VSNTSIVDPKVDPRDIITPLQRRILGEDLKDIHKNNTALAKAVGCNINSITNARKNPDYLVAYNHYKDVKDSQIRDIGKHSKIEAQDALAKMKALVNTSDDPNLYGQYLKLLLDIGKGASEAGWIDTDTTEIDTEGCRADLISMLKMARDGQDIDQIAQYYIDNGKVSPQIVSPSEDIAKVAEAQPCTSSHL